MSIKMHNSLMLLWLLLGVSVISGNSAKSPRDWKSPREKSCDHFHQFVCTGWIAPPADLSGRSIPYAEIHELLTETPEGDDPDTIDPVKNAKVLYETCLATKISRSNLTNKMPNHDGFKNSILGQIRRMGGWPVLGDSSWNESRFNWKRTYVENNNDSYWFNSFFPIELVNSGNETVVYFRDRDFVLRTQTYLRGLKDPDVKYYLEQGIQWAVDLGANASNARREYTEVVEFETEIARITSKHSLDGFVRFKKVTLGKLMQDYPFYPWDEYIQHAFPSHVRIGSDQKLVMENYYDGIFDLYKLIINTSRRVLANYIAWKEVRMSIKSLSDLNFEIFESRTMLEPKNVMCLELVRLQLPLIMETLFTGEYLSRKNLRKNIEDAELIASNVQGQFINILKNTKSLSPARSQKAVEVIESVKIGFSYSSELFHPRILDEYHRALGTSEGDFFGSLVNIRKTFRYKIHYKETRNHGSHFWGSEIRMDGTSAGPTVGVHYDDHNRSSIRLALGLLGSDQTAKDRRSKFIDYGRFAYGVGLGLALILDHDERNIQDDDFERSELDSAGTHFKIECLENRYKDFEDIGKAESDLQAVESSSLDEFTAAGLGLRAAYVAHRNMQSRKADQHVTLHGELNNQDQEFWIHTASTWCQRLQPSDLHPAIITTIRTN